MYVRNVSASVPYHVSYYILHLSFVYQYFKIFEFRFKTNPNVTVGLDERTARTANKKQLYDNSTRSIAHTTTKDDDHGATDAIQSLYWLLQNPALIGGVCHPSSCTPTSYERQ